MKQAPLDHTHKNTVAMTQSEQVLEDLEIVERLSEKQRDKMALYRFKRK
jgi:hypothetical protein